MDIMKLLREAQRMQAQAQTIQDEIAEATFEGSSGGGAVHAVVNGLGILKSVTISPETLDPSDVGMLEDLVVAAVSNAQDQAAQAREEKVQGLTAGLTGMGIPGLDL
jgi:nucleoid-associated protein EbfC